MVTEIKPRISYGAGGRNRTDMDLRPLDFESSASTSFTTPAHLEWTREYYRNSGQTVKKNGSQEVSTKISRNL